MLMKSYFLQITTRTGIDPRERLPRYSRSRDRNIVVLGS